MGIGRGEGIIVNDDSNRCYISGDINPNNESSFNVEIPNNFSIEKPTFSPYKRYCILNNSKIYISYDNKIENILLRISQKKEYNNDYITRTYSKLSSAIQQDDNGKYFFELVFSAKKETESFKPVFNLITLYINSKKIYNYSSQTVGDFTVNDKKCNISCDKNNKYHLIFYIDEINEEVVNAEKNFSIKNIENLSYEIPTPKSNTVELNVYNNNSWHKIVYTYTVQSSVSSSEISLKKIELQEDFRAYTNSGIEIQDNIFLNKRRTSIISAINKVSDSRTNLNKMSLQTNGYVQIYNYCQGLIQELKNIQNSETYETANTNLIQPKDVKLRTTKTENKDVIELTDYSKLVVSQFNSIFAHLIVDPAEWYFSAIDINDENSVYKKIYEAKLNKAINEGTTVVKKDVSEIVYETIGSEP